MNEPPGTKTLSPRVLAPPLSPYLLSWFVLYMRSFVCSALDLVILALSLQYLIGFMWPVGSHPKSCHWASEQCDECPVAFIKMFTKII